MSTRGITHPSVIKTFLLYFATRWYIIDMRRDGRGFDHRTLETIRLMAVERVRMENARHRSLPRSGSTARRSTDGWKWPRSREWD